MGLSRIEDTRWRGIFNGTRNMEFRYCRGIKRSCERQLIERKQQRVSRYLETWLVILTTEDHKSIQAVGSRITAVSLPTCTCHVSREIRQCVTSIPVPYASLDTITLNRLCAFSLSSSLPPLPFCCMGTCFVSSFAV